MATIVEKNKEPSMKTPDGRERIFLVGKDRTGSKHLAADVVTYSPRAHNKDHYHKSETFIYIIDGECDIMFEGSTHHLGKESMVFIPAGERHWLQNNTDKKMVMLEAFAPDSDFKAYYPDQT
jgi:quercetin dioxygenase-like cupin family protein